MPQHLFRTPISNDADRVCSIMNAHSGERGLNGVTARVGINLLQPFVKVFEGERARETPPAQFVNAVTAAVCNILAATIKFTIQPGEQARTLHALLDTVREQVEPRLETPPLTAVFFAGLDPAAGSRAKAGDKATR